VCKVPAHKLVQALRLGGQAFEVHIAACIDKQLHTAAVGDLTRRFDLASQQADISYIGVDLVSYP